jgi:hypothetical protein
MDGARQADRKPPGSARRGAAVPAAASGRVPALATAVVTATPSAATDLLELQRAAGNQAIAGLFPRPSPVLAVQRANPADLRLPADQAEALVRAKDAKADIDAALAALAADPAPERKNTADYVAAQKVLLRALTPRHDSPVGAPAIRFFPGENDYTESFTADGETTHHAGSLRKGVWIRARDSANVDVALGADEIANRLVAAVSEIAFTRAAGPGAPGLFAKYRARFNGLYGVAPFSAKSDDFDPGSTSKGPRTERARAVFERIYEDEPAVKLAYDKNTAGIRERIDLYTVPDGLNQVNSPRLQELRQAFFNFAMPVPNGAYPAFKAAITAAAAGLDDTDHKAVDDSNDWQKLINAHLPDDVKQGEIRQIISGKAIAPAPPPAAPAPAAPAAPLTLAELIANWDPMATVATGGDVVFVAEGDKVKYVAGGLLLRAGAQLTGGKPNSGLVVFVRASVLRGAVVAAPAKTDLLPARGTDITMELSVLAPAGLPAGGEVLTIRAELLGPDKTTLLAPAKEIHITAEAEVPFTQAQAEAAAAADKAHLLDDSPAGIVGQLNALGGQHARLAEAMQKGVLDVEPMTLRHDSAAFVAAQGGTPSPSAVGYFVGPTYGPDSLVNEPNVNGLTIDFLKVLVKRTVNVPANTKAKDEDIIKFLIHEAVHAFDDPFWHGGTNDPIDSYKTEFRAYWMDGGFGPPDQAVCPAGAADCKDATVDPSMPAKGPKSPRARAIFEHLYADYDYVKPAYDQNKKGFRDQVDAYVVPDGINLLVSVRLEQLRRVIAGMTAANFGASRTQVQAFAGIGPPPADGALTAEESLQVAGNRAWRDLVEAHVPGAANKALIKSDLDIP